MEWTEEKLNQYIQSGIEESLTLEYKAAGALDSSTSKKQEITKDVSSMANSAGGTIIYGIGEDRTNRQLPGSIGAVDRGRFSKEWLEQVINNIQPRIAGVVISVVTISGVPSGAVYIVSIPQSDTAHQAMDRRYYKRFNFMSEPMYDHEVRDVMNRAKSPRLTVECLLTRTSQVASGDDVSEYEMWIFLKNSGPVYARYVSGVIHTNRLTLADSEIQKLQQPLLPLATWNVATLCKDTSALPLLPGTSALLLRLQLTPFVQNVLRNIPTTSVSWILYADNARPRKGKSLLTSLPSRLEDMQLFDNSEVP